MVIILTDTTKKKEGEETYDDGERAMVLQQSDVYGGVNSYYSGEEGDMVNILILVVVMDQEGRDRDQDRLYPN